MVRASSMSPASPPLRASRTRPAAAWTDSTSPATVLARSRWWLPRSSRFPPPARMSTNHGRLWVGPRSEEHTSELQSQSNLVCRLLLEKKNTYRHDQEFLRSDPWRGLSLHRRLPRGNTFSWLFFLDPFLDLFDSLRLVPVFLYRSLAR